MGWVKSWSAYSGPPEASPAVFSSSSETEILSQKATKKMTVMTAAITAGNIQNDFHCIIVSAMRLLSVSHEPAMSSSDRNGGAGPSSLSDGAVSSAWRARRYDPNYSRPGGPEEEVNVFGFSEIDGRELSEALQLLRFQGSSELVFDCAR